VLFTTYFFAHIHKQRILRDKLKYQRSDEPLVVVLHLCTNQPEAMEEEGDFLTISPSPEQFDRPWMLEEELHEGAFPRACLSLQYKRIVGLVLKLTKPISDRTNCSFESLHSLEASFRFSSGSSSDI